MAYQANTIAKYIINYCNEKGIPISNLKLQKLLYFAWVEYYKKTRQELFHDDICAWQLGPVIPDVYFEYCAFGGKTINRMYGVDLEKPDKSTIDSFLNNYTQLSASALVDKSHAKGSAWDVVYKQGVGNKDLIPHDLIILTECQ